MAQEQDRETPAFKPYVPDSTTLPEFTPRAVILGMLFGIIFGAQNVVRTPQTNRSGRVLSYRGGFSAACAASGSV
jgi:hypothetical protein